MNKRTQQEVSGHKLLQGLSMPAAKYATQYEVWGLASGDAKRF